MTKHQVAIVGGGPVGVGLAVELGLRGIDAIVIERRLALQPIPKGQNLFPRTLEHFWSWGIDQELRARRIMPKGMGNNGVIAYKDFNSPYWYVPAQREIVRQWYFQDVERVPQYLTEEVLRTRMAQCDSVDALFGWTADSITQDETGVRVGIVDANGTRDVVEAEYVVGCDGGRSRMANALGIRGSGGDYDQKMVLAVFRSTELHEQLVARFPLLSTYNALHPDHKGYWQFFGRVDIGKRWFFHAPVPTGTTLENTDFAPLLSRAAGFPFAIEFDHVGFWDLRVTVADTYRAGRGFIAGDAAHSHPPYGGFGVNTGLEDARNLGWKLAAKFQGWGGESLLDSYSAERRPIFEETGRDFIAGRIHDDRDWLAGHSPEHEGETAFAEAWSKRKQVLDSRIQNYEPHYDGSPVIAGPAGARTSAHGKHAFEARAGHHLTPTKLSNGQNMFELLGRDFTLVALGSDGEIGAAARAFEAAARSARVPLKIVRERFEGETAQLAKRLILVRPDHFVAWADDSLSAPAETIVRLGAGQ
jgi:2-polyprenyl-6-methoxyphenol hydroxylase-like FAD-dependent oxidoreductase